MGIASLILGIISLIIGFVPLCGSIALLPAIIGTILGIIDISKKSKTGEKKSQAIAGLIMSAIAVVVIIFWIFVASGVEIEADSNFTNEYVANKQMGEEQKQENIQKEEKVDKEQKGKNEITQVGETLVTEYFKVTVKSLKVVEGNSVNKPSSGKEFVQVQLEIENISNQDFNISSILMFDAYCDGYSINESLMAQVADNSVSTMNGALASGKKIKGQLAYELPIDWTELEVDVDLTTLKWSNDGKIKIKLQNQ